MDATGSQTNLQHSESFQGRCDCAQLPCASCCDSRSGRGLGPVVADCLQGCHSAELGRLDDEILSTSQCLSDLLTDRQRITNQPRLGTIIHRMPVEIISAIFVFVKEAIFASKFERYPKQGYFGPLYKQPSQSPPLLVGTVCRVWREITLTTPQLWTDIIVDLKKCKHGQLDMIKNWADRSKVLPLDITLHLNYRGRDPDQRDIAIKFGDVCSALKLLVVRWNNVALDVPGFICHILLHNLQEAPHINSLLLSAQYGILRAIDLRYPLRPRRFLSCGHYNLSTAWGPQFQVPFKWDRLLFLQLDSPKLEHLFHILRCAPNLQSCIVTGSTIQSAITTNVITNHSVKYFRTDVDILGQLTLPSLQQLDYKVSALGALRRSIESLLGFLARSRPSLDEFTLRHDICQSIERIDIPCFQQVPGVTSLFFKISDLFVIKHPSKMENFLRALTQPVDGDPILPCLKELSIELPDLSTLSWSLFSCLFPKNTQEILQDVEGGVPSSSFAFMRPLSQVSICLTETNEVTMNKDTFLHLQEVKKSGVDLSLRNIEGDMFSQMANAYGVEL